MNKTTSYFDMEVANMECLLPVISFLYFNFVTTFGYDNLSRFKSAMQSSKNDDINASPTRAIDMDISTCSSTDKGNPAWWYVDLQKVKSIYDIQIYFNRISDIYEHQQKQRMYGFQLYVSNTTEVGRIKDGHLCYIHNGPSLPVLSSSHLCVTFGRYVFFYNERRRGVAYPDGSNVTYVQLCEVIVNGCETEGVYGTNCFNKCPENCQEHRCYLTNGTCAGCIKGWNGRDCRTPCLTGYFGIECGNKCLGNCINNETCNHISGYCDNGCSDGWTGQFCNTMCTPGTYGRRCSNTCSGNCLNGTPCNKVTGNCDEGCVVGYHSEKCDQACLRGYFGNECGNKCSGNCINNETCNHISGYCDNGCSNGWTGQFCNIMCTPGTYGRRCSNTCSGNCLNGTPCNKVTGNCDEGCVVGYRGEKCDQVCPSGTFGKDCKKICSGNCVNNDTCSRVDGECVNGCTTGYWGHLCNEKCQNGTYGINCSSQCNPNCAGRKCVQWTGSCSNGCLPGWQNTKCDEACSDGYFGDNCKQTCSGNCADNDTCDHVNGYCLKGCREGFGGKRCESASDSKRNDEIGSVLVLGLSSALGSLFLLTAAGCLFLLCFFRRSKKRKAMQRTNSCTSSYFQGPLVNRISSHAGDTHMYEEFHSEIRIYDTISPEL